MRAPKVILAAISVGLPTVAAADLRCAIEEVCETGATCQDVGGFDGDALLIDLAALTITTDDPETLPLLDITHSGSNKRLMLLLLPDGGAATVGIDASGSFEIAILELTSDDNMRSSILSGSCLER